MQRKIVRMKRILYILGVIVASLLLLLGLLVGALMSDRVETLAMHITTAQLSNILGTEVRVGAVEYRFPARVSFKDVYIEDQQRDTLLYAQEVYAHFLPLALQRDEIRFSHVRLTNAKVNLYQLPDSTWNYAFVVEAFRRPKQENSPLQSLISVRDVRLDNVDVRIQDYVTHVQEAKMDLHEFSEQRIEAQICKLKAEVKRVRGLEIRGLEDEGLEEEKFIIEDLKAHVILNDTLLSLPILEARLPQSHVDMSGIEVHFPPGDTLYLSKSAHDITFALAFREAEVVPSDIQFFIPKLSRMTRPVSLTGQVGGTLDSLWFDDMEVRYNGNTLLQGNISAVGLPNFEDPYLRANLVDLHTNAPRLQDFLSQLSGKPVRLPKEVHRLGDIHYRGLAEGRLHHMSLHGAFRTALGTITTDGTAEADSTFEHIDFDAHIVGRQFRLGKMLAIDKMGTLTLDVKTSGQVDKGVLSGDINAHVRDFTYNDYTYSDLHMDGRYDPKRYKGTCAIHDPHLDVAFDGNVDLRDKNPEIKFHIACRHFDSSPLGIEAIGSNLRTRFVLKADMSGAKLDEMSGSLVLDSLFLATSRDSVRMRSLRLLASADPNGTKAITLRNDWLQARMDGLFRYKDIAPACQALMHHYLPTAVAAPERNWKPVTMSIQMDGERLRDVQRLFSAPLTLSDHPTLRAKASLAPNAEPHVDMRFFAPGIRAANTPVHDLTITLNTIDTLRHAGAKGSGLALSVSAEAMQMYTVLSTLAFHDTLLTHLTLRQQATINENLPEDWKSMNPRELQRALSADLSMKDRTQALVAAQRAGTYGGDIQCITHFAKYNNKPLIDMHFMPGTLLLRDSVYTLGESRLTYTAADTSLVVDHFLFEGAGQHLLAHGLASPRVTDTLSVDLQRIDASYVVPFVLPVQTIMFNGLLTGRADIKGVFKHPMVDTQIHIDSMGLNSCYFGDADVDLHIADSLAFHADVYRPDRKVVDLDGKALFDGSGKWELDMQANQVPLAFVNHWTYSVLDNLDGYGTGHVVVGGEKESVYVLLRAQAQNASFTLPWTGVRYTIPADTIVMDTTAIRFPNVHCRDMEGNPVVVNGGVYHNQFQNFQLDLHVDAKEALVFDSEKKGEMLQGHVYGTGHVDVTGDEMDILVSADAVTDRNSRFRLSIDNVASAYESSFVHFVAHNNNAPDYDVSEEGESELDNIDIKEEEKKSEKSGYTPTGRCLLKLNLEVNPRLLFQLVLGERNGDMIAARGSGAIQLTYDTQTEDVSLLGTYDIEQGTMSYTVANVIRKEFTVGEGSTIVFSGDVTDPQLNVTAKYRVVANLRDLFGDDAEQIATSRSNIPVLTCLHLSGLLSNPILSFSLEFPQSDQTIQQQVKQIINTDEMLMRQVIYLLVFGRFFTPDYMSNAQYATLNSTYSLLSSTVTSQINSWLSKLTNIFTLGVAIRTEGAGDNSSQEYEAQFQLQPVDRLVINGNVGYRYNDVSNQPFFGDLDVEVLLTEDGQWRLKGYTHTVDKYSLRQASTIQGVGFMWKKDFNWPEPKKKKTESAKGDSTKK